MESKENQSLTFLDLSAAFDTLSRDIFCSKLKAYGFDLTSRNWFRSYLTDRSQCVMIGSHMSSKVTLKVGSPQGAILSPTIFIILISDIELWTDAAICGYADDTSCTNSDECMEKLREKCEKSVNSLLKYMAANKLYLQMMTKPTYWLSGRTKTTQKSLVFRLETQPLRRKAVKSY